MPKKKADAKQDPLLVEVRALAAQVQSLGANLDSRGRQFDSLNAHVANLGVQIQAQGLLLGEMRSQSRATIEAVQAAQQATDLRFDQLEARLTARIEVLESVARSNSADIRQNSADIRDLKAAVAVLEGAVRDAAHREALERLERRVEALEKRIA